MPDTRSCQTMPEHTGFADTAIIALCVVMIAFFILYANSSTPGYSVQFSQIKDLGICP